MQEVYLCLDVGGTEIKAAPLDKRGNFSGTCPPFPGNGRRGQANVA